MKYDIPEAELRRLYLDEMRGQKEIAKIYGCTPQTIVHRMKSYGIKTRPINTQRVIDRNRGLDSKKKDLVIIPGQPIDCNLQGDNCIYRGRKSDGMKDLCDYYFKTGKLRWCDPEQCTKYRFK